MVREVKTMRKHGIALTLEDYLTFFQARVRQISVNLDRTELRIIDRLLKDPSFSQSKLASELQLSDQWVSRKISELQGKYVLRKFDRVPFSRIGIRMFHLLGRLTDEETDAFQLLKDCPFLYSFRRVVSGYWHFLATLSVPDNIESMQSLEKGCDMARGWGMETSLLEIASSGVSTCFDYYSVEKAEWYMPWALMSVQLKRIYEDGLASAAPRIDRPAAKTRSELDELDMKIVDCIRRGVTSVAEIRHALRVGQQRIADRLKVLRDEGLIVTTWEAHNIGLVESEVLTVQDPKAGESISAWAQRLPRCIVSFDTSRRLVLLADLPLGGTYGFSTAVAVLPHCVNSGLLNYKVYGEWGFPVELWDSGRQRWLCPTEKTNAWLSTLR
jgi:DNA-binding Lrp family transcriptional regulator